MAVLYHFFPAERTDGVENVLVPRELGDLTELLLGEINPVKLRPVLNTKEVQTH
jgi:hypothetical protein